MTTAIPESNPNTSLTIGDLTQRLTMAHLLHTAVLTLAAILRLNSLGQPPLSPSEASAALAVWGAWQPASVVAEPFLASSPAYFSLTSLLTLFLGYSDSVMRLVPALAGMALVVLPFLLRRQLGDLGALVAALALALSPTLTAVSRTAGGESLAVLAAGVLLVGWVRYQDQKTDTNPNNWFFMACAALGAGLATAPLFYSFLLTLGLAWGLQHTAGPRLFASLRQPDRETSLQGGITAVVVFIMLGLALLTYPNGLGGALRILAGWLGTFGLPSDLTSWLNPVLSLVRYDTAVVIVGLTGALWATWQKRPWGSFLAYWLMSGLILLFIQPGELSNVLVTAVAGYLLIGVVAQAIFPRNQLRDWSVWPLAALFLVLGLIMAHGLGRYARSVIPQNSNSYLSLTIMAFMVWLVILGMIVAWEKRVAWQALFLSLLLLTAVSSWGAAWRLGHTAANDPRERWIEIGTAENAQQLAPFIAELSGRYRGAANASTIFSTLDHPSLRWYLRDFPQAQYGHTLPPGATYDMVITPSTADPQLGADYTGTDFELWYPAVAHDLNLLDGLRWWLFYESPVALTAEQGVLWLRADLTQPEN